MKVAIVSGYFDPLHVGHIELLEKAHQIGDYVLILLNSDENAIQKKGYVFMPYDEREKIIDSLWMTHEIVRVRDRDGTCIKTLEIVKDMYPNEELIFCKGGDRTKDEIPETPICKKLNIKILDKLGGKIQSSSELVEKTREIK